MSTFIKIVGMMLYMAFLLIASMVLLMIPIWN